MNPPSPALGLMHFWEAGDAVTHSVAWLLLAMSLISWYLILSKAWSAWRLRSGARAALEDFWNAADAEAALRALTTADTERAFVPLAERAFQAARTEPRGVLAASVDRSELITRTLRQEINRTSARLEAGLTLLASIGSTAPFIGLFGTVWGIYHALIAIAASGQVQIDRIAGHPGGEIGLHIFERIAHARAGGLRGARFGEHRIGFGARQLARGDECFGLALDVSP